MNEQHWFELDVTVTGADGQKASIHREYQSKDAASADKAASEVWDAVSQDAKARMRPVNDGR